MAQYEYFPLFFSMENKNIFIIGGGQVAERRMQSLLEFGAKMTVVSPKVTEKIRLLSDEQDVRWIPECYREAHLCQETDFVLVCTDDEVLNHRIAMFCKEKGIPVNNASCKEDSDFYFPALIRHDGLVFGVSSDGSDHKKVRSVCEKIRRLLQNK